MWQMDPRWGGAVATKFGLLAKLEFLQDWASIAVARMPSAVAHNLEKYHALKKVHYLAGMEDMEGDYLEFGVFTGSSLCHAVRCVRALLPLNARLQQTRFFGFDSFSGFGELPDDEKHPFFQDANFTTSLERVQRRVGRVAGGFDYQLVPGFFEDSLKAGAAHYGIEKARVIFIDSDTYSSAREALTFCLPTIQQGTFLVLDDYYSYRGARQRGIAGAFTEFLEQSGIDVRQLFTYGMGGAVFVVAATHQGQVIPDHVATLVKPATALG
jgi:O-methyltransferase